MQSPSSAPEQLALLPQQPGEPHDPERLRHRELDRLCKTVMAIDRGRCLRWICTPALCRLLGLPEGIPVLLAQLDKEFSDIKRAGDYLLEVAFGVLILVLHWEFQKRADSHMGLRVHRYQGAIQGKHGWEVVSLVLVIEGQQAEAVRLSTHRVGPISQTGWVSLSLPRLMLEWPEQTDSPMAEMLRALVIGRLDPGYLRSFLERLQRLGLSQVDCRQIMMMLSFLLSIRRGGDGSRYQQIVEEVLAMLELEDSWIYQAGVDKTMDRALSAVRANLTLVYENRHGTVPPSVVEALARIRDLDRLKALMPVILNQGPAAIAAAIAEPDQRPS